MAKLREHRAALGLITILSVVSLSHAQVDTSGSASITERSTVDTIPFQSMDQQALAETAIEGGLAPLEVNTTEPMGPNSENFSAFTDPLLIPVNDNRTGLNRFSLNVDINYQDPKRIPGIQFGNTYNIGPLPANRTYDFYEFSTTER